MLLGLLPVSQVWAQKTQETQTARRIYIEGARFLQQKRYEEASVQFHLAYRLLSKERNPRVQGALRKLRYFLGLCYFKLKKYENAKKYLALFVRTTTSKGSSRYLRAQKMLAVAKAQIALRPRRRPPSRVVRRPPPRPRVIIIKKIIKKTVIAPTRPWRAWPFVVMGIGALGLAAGGVVGAMTNNAVKERDDTHQNLLDASDPFSTPVAALHHKAETLALTTNALFIGGGVVTALGVILIFTSGRGPAKLSPPTKAKSLGKSHRIFPEVE